MDEIAEKMSTALGDAGAEKAIAAIAQQMQKLLAGDVLYEQVVRPEIDGVLAAQRDPRQRRAEEHLPAGRESGSKRAPSATPSAASAAPAPATPPASTASNSPASASTGPNWSKARRARSPAKKASKSKSTVANQGESTENGVAVAVSVDGNTVKGDIDELPARRNRQRRRSR